VRIEYILDDEATPKLAREAMLAAAPQNADIVRYKDTDEHVKAYHVNGLSGWIKSQLQTGPLQAPTQTISSSPTAGAANSRHRLE
jgi:hypothetical protein